jgi:hypothetical protein
LSQRRRLFPVSNSAIKIRLTFNRNEINQFRFHNGIRAVALTTKIAEPATIIVVLASLIVIAKGAMPKQLNEWVLTAHVTRTNFSYYERYIKDLGDIVQKR